MANPYVVTTQDSQRFSVHYEDNGDPNKRAQLEGAWKHFNRYDPATNQTYYIWYRPTNRNSEVQVEYRMPPDAPLGLYRVEIFVPGRHATTEKAIFTVANNFQVKEGQVTHDEAIRSIDMYHLYDVWKPLGEFILDPGSQALSGRVKQYDLSLEDPPAEISFGPVRWVPLSAIGPGQPPEKPPVQAGEPNRYDSPVGSQAERDGDLLVGVVASGWGPVWHGSWYDANPFLSWYSYGYHTGADLNIIGVSSADKDAPIHAIADGTVRYAGEAGSWGNIVVIEHAQARVTLPDGSVHNQKVYSRYGHVSDAIQVHAGDNVARGAVIAFVGLPEGATTGWHLHFDICYTQMLKNRPAHWPNLTRIRELQKKGTSPNAPEFRDAQLGVKKEVLANYVDPYHFLRDNHHP